MKDQLIATLAKFRAILVSAKDRGQNSLEYIGLAIIAGVIIVAVGTAIAPALTNAKAEIGKIANVSSNVGGGAGGAGQGQG